MLSELEKIYMYNRYVFDPAKISRETEYDVECKYWNESTLLFCCYVQVYLKKSLTYLCIFYSRTRNREAVSFRISSITKFYFGLV